MNNNLDLLEEKLDSLFEMKKKAKREHEMLPEAKVRGALRKACNITQQELGDLIGAERSALANWELGKHLPESDAMLLKYAKVLELLHKKVNSDEDTKVRFSRFMKKA